MKTSEALASLHERLYGEIDLSQQATIEQTTQEIYSMIAQAPSMLDRELTKLTFETPANILQEHQQNPSAAQEKLLSSIAAAQAWETVGRIEHATPPEEEIRKLLKQFGFWRISPNNEDENTTNE